MIGSHCHCDSYSQPGLPPSDIFWKLIPDRSSHAWKKGNNRCIEWCKRRHNPTEVHEYIYITDKILQKCQSTDAWGYLKWNRCIERVLIFAWISFSKYEFHINATKRHIDLSFDIFHAVDTISSRLVQGLCIRETAITRNELPESKGTKQTKIINIH